MRFIVYGAGAIGGVIGGRLAEHGHDVVLIARGEHYRALRANGLTLESPDATVTLDVPVVDHPSAITITTDDVVIFAYRATERPIDLFSTFGPEDHEIFVSLYQARPYLLDPFYHAARAGRAGVFRMRELAPDRFFSSEYYRTYYSQTKLAEEVGFFVPCADGVTVVLSLMRREGSGIFPAGEFAMLAEKLGFDVFVVGILGTPNNFQQADVSVVERIKDAVIP